jgi:hypothetical protein
MSDKKTLNFCPECGEKQIGNKFCTNCGYALLKESSEKIKLKSKNSKTGIEDILLDNLKGLSNQSSEAEKESQVTQKNTDGYLEHDSPSKDYEQEIDKSVTSAADTKKSISNHSFLDLDLAIPFYIIFAFVNCIIAPGMNGVGFFNDLLFALVILVLPYILLVIVFSLFKSLFNLKFVFYYHNGFFGLSLLCESLIVYGAIN